MKIYVSKLSRDVTEKDLEKAFSVHGKVDSATISINPETGLSNSFGYVEMSKDNEAKKAIEELNGKKIKGSAITVEEAKNLKKQKPDRSKDGIPGRSGRQKY